MSRVHSLRFDALEERKLLTARAAGHARPVKPTVVATPLVLDGTLAVNNKAMSSSQNPDSSTMTTVPVSGQFGALGQLAGVWNETTDEFGEPTGPDALRLRNSSGTLVIAFNNANPGKPRPFARGSVFVEDAQLLFAGTGAYAHATEKGSVEIVSNRAGKAVELVLHTRGT